MTNIAKTKERLELLEDALYKLLTQKLPATVEVDGRSVIYTRADVPTLKQEILALKIKLNEAPRRAALGFVMG